MARRLLSVLFFVLPLGFSLIPVPDDSEEQTTLNREPLEIRNTTYAGTWESPKAGLWGAFTTKTGRGKFMCINFYPEWHNLFESQLLLYNSMFEDQPPYALRFFENRFDYEDRSVIINCTARLYNLSDYEKFVRVDGRLTFTTGPTMTGHVRGPSFSISVNMTPLDFRSPKVLYTLIVTVLSMVHLWVILTITKECVESERVAASISRWFPLMNCAIEGWLIIWHLMLAVRFAYSFNYLILTVFWNFLVVMANFKRLLVVVWQAYSREMMFVDAHPSEADSSEYSFGAHESRYIAYIILLLLVSFIFSSIFPVLVVLMYCFFLPQIMSNAFRFKRNRIRPALYISFGLVRLTLIWYWFGYPENVMMWEPNVGFCIGITVLVVVQMVALHGQSSRERTWLFAPKAMRTDHFDYYQDPGPLLENQTECVICMTLLPTAVESGDAVNTSKPVYSPCGHTFHEDCLRNWTRIKLECPVCRRRLPPLADEDDCLAVNGFTHPPYGC